MVELDQEYFNDAKSMFSEIWSHIPEFKEFLPDVDKWIGLEGKLKYLIGNKS